MDQISDYTVEDTSSVRLKATPEGIAAFVDARFGLTAHWGLYALIAKGEWALHHKRIPHDEYKALADRFNPTRFDADEWADLLLESGQKFFLITTKHNDGFCLWDTKLTSFKVTNTPLKRDSLAELSAALSVRGLGLHYYYSLLDWTHPAYRNDWPAYVEYYQGQIRELMTDYGPIGGIVFDGYWPRFTFGEDNAHFAAGGPLDLAGTYDLIHELQPGAVISNNHHVLPLKGEDYQVFELDMPGENTAGIKTTQVGDRANAAWWNLNSGWSYTPPAHRVKSAADMLARLREANKKNATFFLNVGPRPWGDIHPEEARVLREMGPMARDYLK